MVDEYGGASAFVEMVIPASIDDFKEMAGVLKDFDFEHSRSIESTSSGCGGGWCNYSMEYE